MIAMMALALAPQALPENGWVQLEQPAVAGTEQMGCHGSERASLDARHDHWSINDDDDDYRPDATFDRIHVYIEMRDGAMEQVRTFTPDCVVDGREKARVLQAGPAAVIQWLANAQRDADDQLESQIAATVAHIDHPAAFDTLVGWAEDLERDEQGDDALFWLAQRRGDEGRKVVQAHAGENWPTEHREHAIMSLALSEHPDAMKTVREAAREARPAEVRAQAVMALGITDAPGALADLHSIFLTDTDPGVREQAIFAMSQLDNPDVAQTLADIIREPRFGEYRKHALFWLTNVHGEESEAVMDELVNDIF